MKNKIILFLSISSIIITSSCEKFFDIALENNSNLNRDLLYTSDYQELLNAQTHASFDGILLDMMSDDVFMTDAQQNVALGINYINAYLWKEQLWNDNDQDYIYNSSYFAIMNINAVINNIDNSLDKNYANRNRIKAEAKIQRAWNYLQLVNIYGKAYNSQTANIDLGVPLVTNRYVEGDLPARATVAQIYTQIITDLNDAISTDELSDFGPSFVNPGKAAAYALMSRTYLFMNNYTSALEYANKALDLKNSLYNYENYIDLKNKIPQDIRSYLNNDDENFLLRVSNNSQFYSYFKSSINISEDLITVLGGRESKDLRVQMRLNIPTNVNSRVTYLVSNANNSLYAFVGINVPEVMLIKAECLARENQGAEAIEVLNTLRKSRFKEDDYEDLDTNTDNVLQLVLDERRRELYIHGGLRLFDMKRLNLQGLFNKTIERYNSNGTTLLATLEPNSPRYIVPFSPLLLFSNPNIKQNER